MKIEFDNGLIINYVESECTWVELLEDCLTALNAFGFVCPKNIEELVDEYKD